MVRTIIIDDEKNALEVMEHQLKRCCPSIEILASCSDPDKGIQAIKRYKPDLIFLDIEMPHKNGFDVLNETKGLGYDVIFTTAYNQFAIKAFKFSALDYLLKPIDVNELKDAVEKVQSKLKNENFQEKVQKLFDNYFIEKSIVSDNGKIALPIGSGFEFISTQEIIRCESISNYSQIFLIHNKRITLSRTLKEVEEILTGLNFCIVHQSHLININHISKYFRGEGGYVIMSDGSNIPISRNKKDNFITKFRKL